MKTTYKYIITAILVGAIAIPALAYGEESLSVGGSNTNGADTDSGSLSVGGGDTNGADVNPSGDTGLTTGGNNTNGADTEGGLTVGGGNTNGADVNPSNDPGLTTGGNNTNGADTETPTTSNPGSGNTSGGGGRSGGGSSRTTVTLGTSTLPLLTDIGQCSYLNSYLKLGANNPSSEVLKLQAFLSAVENIPVASTGVFDTETFEAVKTFQSKYVTEIMLPWGVTTPTGQVWYTTKKKINEVFCKVNFALTPAQIAEIEAYRLGLTVVGAVDALGNPVNATGTIPLLPEVGSNATNSQTAALGDLSLFQKFVNFLKWLFHR